MSKDDYLREIRQKAEKKIRKSKLQSGFDSMDKDALIQELLIYQVELEMQNQELRASQERLETSNRRYYRLFDISPVAYIVLDEKSRIVNCNLTAARAIQRKRLQLLEQPFIKYLEKEDVIVFSEHLKDVFSGKANNICEVNLRKGSVFEVHSTILPGEGEDAPVCLSVLFDMQEHKKMAKEMEIAKKHAEEASKLKSEFLANVSHEIRTPMTSIIGYSDILLHDIQTPEFKQKLEVINKASKGLLLIINDILDISKIEAGELALCPKEFSLSNVLRYIELLFEVKANEKGITFSMHEHDLPDVVLGDDERIRQVLTNIIGNAIKFTLRDGIVAVNCEYRQGNVVIQVKDNGIGIPKEKQQSIFLPFIQGDSSPERNFKGTGLGLSITKRIVELLRGTILLQSEEGKGTTFTIQIPLPVVEWVKKKSTPRKKLNSKPNGNSVDLDSEVNILVVDDDFDIRNLIRLYVLAMGYEPDTAENGKVALEMLEKKKYDMVLLDMQMPVMNGRKTIKLIRQNPKLKRTHVIALTASALRGDQEKFIDAGCDDYITKPIDNEALAEKIRQGLANLEFNPELLDE